MFVIRERLYAHPVLYQSEWKPVLNRLTQLAFHRLKPEHVRHDIIVNFPLYLHCLLFSWRYNPLWFYFNIPVAGFSLLVFKVSWSHTTTRHSRPDSPGRVINPSQRPLPDNTQHSQQTDIHAPGGIRTYNLSRRAAEDLRLRPRGCWDRLFICITGPFSWVARFLAAYESRKIILNYGYVYRLIRLFVAAQNTAITCTDGRDV